MRTLEVLRFDSWLDDSRKWRAEIIECGCGHRYVAVYREDRYPVCPKCVITDRADVLEAARPNWQPLT